jgi:hypothetical protein
VPAIPVSETTKPAPTTTREEARKFLSGEMFEDTPTASAKPISISSTERTQALSELAGIESKKPETPKAAPPVPPAQPKPPVFSSPKQEEKIIFTPPPVQPLPPRPVAPPLKPIESVQRVPEPVVIPNPARTLQTDVAHAIENKTVSLASIALSQDADKRAAAQQFKSSHTHPYARTLLIGGAVLFFMVGGAVAVYYAFEGEPQKPVITKDNSSKTFLIKPDVTYTLALGTATSTLPTQFKTALANQNSADGAIGAFTILFKNEKKKDVELTGTQFITALFPQIPAQFVASLDTTYMAGRFASPTQNFGFLVFSLSSYEDTFASLNRLSEQNALLLARLLNPSLGEQKTLSWKNVFIKNIDARVLVNDADEILLAYTFLNKKTLLITTDKDAFIALTARYTTP